MKVSVEVENREEAALLQSAASDPVMKASAIILGALRGLPSKRARERVMAFVNDLIAEERNGEGT